MKNTEDGEEKKAGGGIQSLARASAIIREVVSHRDGIGLAQLSKAVGLHNSTTFHLVRTLATLGYVRQDETTKLYRVGRTIFDLASSAFDEIEIASIAGPFVDELAMRTGETSHLAIRSANDIVVVARSDGTGAFRMAERTGITRPPHATALGKILLSGMNSRGLHHFLAQTELRRLTPRTIVDPDRLAKEIETIRQSGIAYDEGEFHAEIRCVAVPVRNYTGSIVAAMGVSTPVWRLSLNEFQEKADILKSIAADLSASFGYTGEPAPRAGEASERPARRRKAVARGA